MELTSESQNEVDNAEDIKNLKKVEASLFIAGRFLSLQELVALTDINPLLLRELVEKLVEKYDENSAIEVLQQEDRWKMDVKQEYRNLVNRLATGTAEFSKAEQETLAIIAYKQPVKQSVIVNIRGNKAYDHISNFIEMGLVRAKKVGHTKELSLSEDFYDYFTLGKKEAEVGDEGEAIEKEDISNAESEEGEEEGQERQAGVEEIKEKNAEESKEGETEKEERDEVKEESNQMGETLETPEGSEEKEI